jgi:hypothetical protein
MVRYFITYCALLVSSSKGHLSDYLESLFFCSNYLVLLSLTSLLKSLENIHELYHAAYSPLFGFGMVGFLTVLYISHYQLKLDELSAEGQVSDGELLRHSYVLLEESNCDIY